MDVVVTGIGLRSALGNLVQSWHSLLAGQSGLQIAKPFSSLPPRPMGLLQAQPCTQLLPLTLAVVTEALADAKLTTPLTECAVVFGSSRHQQAQWEALAFHSASSICPMEPAEFPLQLQDWMQLWPGSAAIATAQFLQSTAPVLSPMAACATGLWAIAQGFELIQMGYCQQVVVVAAEAPITPLVLAGFEQAGVLARTGVYPFDVDREGLAIAEGGAALVLENLDSAQHRHVSPYGQILGFGLSADAYHVTSPDPRGKGVRAAIQACLQHSRLQPGQIDFIHTHGTGTRLNDQNEAALIAHHFPHRPPCSSTKGSTGHTLGASGLLGAAFTLMALKTQTLPPTVGLRSPAFPLSLVTQAAQQQIENALCFSFGFGRDRPPPS
jgi:3-oxoacyl-[acyl-carrier-protein] synthase II